MSVASADSLLLLDDRGTKAQLLLSRKGELWALVARAAQKQKLARGSTGFRHDARLSQKPRAGSLDPF